MTQSSAGRLLVFSLATFEASLLLLVLVYLAFKGGSLGEQLDGLSTEAGLALFAVLWASTWYCTSEAIDGLTQRGIPPTYSISARGLFWGGVNGVMFFVTITTAGAVYLAVFESNGIDGILRSIPAFFFITSLGS